MDHQHIQLEHSFSGQLMLPKYVYHATITRYVDPLKKRLLDRTHWRKTDRDFGPAFYTTISFDQAADWAIKAEEKTIGATGCILKIQCHPERFPGFNNCLAFLGETNLQWTKFIVDHRYECDERGKDPCGRGNHPAIVIGQMADNKMDIVKDEYDQRSGEIMDIYGYFSERIIREEKGQRLDALKLGNQIAFCDEGLNELLSVVSYLTYDEKRKEWVDHESYIRPL